ncbi:excisionase family DNA-binding protein [Anaerobacillus isosaccharinicus]|uniref:Excisionase family DNA-binding protein n=1 Tax=Anaerobacillus isosaccharinicus TaxID=1532552 RepID=A0A1S2L789_9BACI|nr:excisionase family DNA-binding protein [Anaerobacillus isosaccharinicus]MBA5587656.1 excisionase family DNA-binding protein [Anaerobacillus isosaccharinicus]QOY34171.1 excisionase family DNA-binding protein [Anaerobacillus isosaccharinicus]
MYITIKELADFLHLSPDYVYQQIQSGNIRAVHDGNEYLVNKEQFTNTREEIEKEILLWREEQLQDLPADIDVKDED